jgi:multiple sugar transport system substrate-binding protein
MTITRRTFGAATLAAIGAATAARGQSGGVSFMSYTYAEDPNRPFIQKVMDDFRTSAGVGVEPIGSAWGDMQRNVLLRQRSKTLPDSAQLQERWMPALATIPEIVDLDKLFGRTELERAIDPQILALGRVDGRQIGMPLITGSIGMIANREVLAKAGIEKMPETLAEFRSALVAVRDKVANSVPFAMATKNANSIPLDVLIVTWAHGGRIVGDDGKVLIGSDAGRAAFDFLAGLLKDRLVAPEIDRPDARRLFGQGAAAFYIDAPVARTFARSFSGRGAAADAFTIPMRSPVLKAGDQPRSIEWGHTVALFEKGAPITRDSPSARWLSHLISDGVQTTLPMQMTALPVTKTARQSAAFRDDAFLRAWAEAAGQTMRHEIGVWSNAPELSTILGEETQAALLGQKAPAQAVAALQTRMEASMAKRG